MNQDSLSTEAMAHKGPHSFAKGRTITPTALKEIKSLHRQSMSLAEQALIERAKGEWDHARILAQEAFGIEFLAANIISEYDSEPDRSVLHRSAATLAIECGKFVDAVKLIRRGLRGQPPAEIAQELEEILETLPKSILLEIPAEEEPFVGAVFPASVRPHTSIRFPPHKVIAGRYEIVRLIGRGAMGEVYEAYDASLNERVALKTVLPEIAPDRRTTQRFRREIQLARKVTHPNVCRIFDVGHHEEEDRSEEGPQHLDVTFLTMELLSGETLSTRLQSCGPMTTAEALPLIEQLAAGLDAAHKAGIVHRDFKCGNVILVPSGNNTRAVITDFGLARSDKTSEGDKGSVSVGNEVVGTPDFMSPEQVRAEDITPASDIYSFGVVMYVILTGELPFAGSSERQRALKRLEETPSSPRKYVSELNRNWESAILQCLAKDPHARPSSGDDVVRIIRGETPGKARVRWSGPRVSTAIAAIISLLTILASIPVVRHRIFNRPQPTVEARQLAVLPFTAVNHDEQTAAFARGLAETLTLRLTKLTENHALQVVPASEVQNNHIETLQQARQEFGVNLGLEGSVERSGDMVRVSYHLINAQNARQLHADTITAPSSNPFSLEDDVAASVERALEIEINPREQSSGARPQTTHPGAYDFFLRGRGYLQDYLKPGNVDSAISVFNHALALDASYAPAHAGLGEAYWRQYELTHDSSWTTKARQSCEHAVQLDNQYAEAHECLGTVYQGTGQYEQAVVEFERALELEPTSDDVVRGLASSYASVGKTAEAEQTYRRAISLRPQYWRGYNMLGAFYYAHARYDDAAEMFSQVIALAPDNYRGYTNLGGIRLVQGRYGDAEPLFAHAVAIQPTAEAYSNLGTAYFHLRRYAESAKAFEKAIELNDRDYIIWGNLADAEDRTPGGRGQAEAAYRKAISLAEQQLQVNSRDPYVLSDLADYYSMLRERAQAVDYITRAISLAQNEASVSFKAAQVYVQLGDNDKAVYWLGKAIDAGYSRTIIRDSPVMDGLRSDPRVQKKLGS